MAVSAIDPPDEGDGLWAETAEELYNDAPCGYVTTHLDGTIVRANRTLLDWIGHDDPHQLEGRRFVDLLAGGSRIFHDTHYAPLLLMQGAVRSISFDLECADGRSLPVLVSSNLLTGAHGEPIAVRCTLSDATQRQDYERELLQARLRAEASEEREREVALTLQRSLLHGGLESSDSFTVVTRYRPAQESLEVGGDWYDSFLLPDEDTLAVSVGDVVGRGIIAACAMGQVRSALRAIAGSAVGPGKLLDALDTFVHGLPDARLATVGYLELCLIDGRLTYACAGHLPPLLVHPNGPATFLWGGRSTPLDANQRRERRPEASTSIAAGDRIVLFTDGLIERRDRDLDDGLDLLARTADDLRSLPPAAMADEMMARLLADEVTPDDVCLMVLSFEPPSG